MCPLEDAAQSPGGVTLRNLGLRLGVLAAFALLPAVIGLYGMISYVVAQRTREMGIRLALGARRRDVLGLVRRQGLKLTLIGVAASLALSLALCRFLSSLLFGVSTNDPANFLSVARLKRRVSRRVIQTYSGRVQENSATLLFHV